MTQFVFIANIGALADEIADSLRGQCIETIDSQLEKHGMDIVTAPPELLAAIDQEVFCCSVCDWYCGRDEESETQDGVCDDCEDDE